jgi:hypothetical protein
MVKIKKALTLPSPIFNSAKGHFELDEDKILQEEQYDEM